MHVVHLHNPRLPMQRDMCVRKDMSQYPEKSSAVLNEQVIHWNNGGFQSKMSQCRTYVAQIMKMHVVRPRNQCLLTPKVDAKREPLFETILSQSTKKGSAAINENALRGKSVG